ncbi:hypothetical protein PFISCL1PPCAC_7153, partial [Pristionchus fissidentatus]
LLMLAIGSSMQHSKIPECKLWTCFTSNRCLGGNDDALIAFDETAVKDDCDAIMKIKFYKTIYWVVILESWNSATSIKLSHGTEELFKCAKVGSESIATTTTLR